MVYILVVRRTQIYLDEEQKRRLRSLAAHLDSNVSDLIRRAVDRLLSEEWRPDAWEARFDAWQQKARKRLGNISIEDFDRAHRSATKRGAKKAR